MSGFNMSGFNISDEIEALCAQQLGALAVPAEFLSGSASCSVTAVAVRAFDELARGIREATLEQVSGAACWPGHRPSSYSPKR